MLRSSLLFCFLIATVSLWGQTATIRGRAADYAGREISFYTIPEPISHQQKMLATARIGQDGSFDLILSTSQPIEVYTDLEKFRGTLVVVPGAQYQITLPPFSPRTVQESASPYFEPELYWLGIKDTKPSDLNFLVRAFLTDYNRELAAHTMDIYQKKSADTVHAIVARLEKSYPTGNVNYLNTLKTYSYAELEYLIAPTEKERIIQRYFATKEVFLAHPAYQHFFNTLFSDYLSYKTQDLRDKVLVTKALQGDFDGFVNALTEKGFAKWPAELVAVKCFYDGYYSGKFNKSLMLKGLQEASTKSTCAVLAQAMPEILRKATRLQEGSPAPVMALKNQQDTRRNLVSQGKYVYLAFFRSDSKSCRAELDSLVTLEKKLRTGLNIVPVSLDTNFADAAKLWKEKKYPWELCGATNAEKVRADYQIKSLPAFYLITPDLKLLLSPALAPSHNFESLFLKIYRESRFRKQ